MPEPRNRRAETHARGLLKRAETLVGRASRHLFNGDPLVAMRMLRAAEHLNLLDSRLRIKRDAERKSLAARAADDMKERERACQQREELLEFVDKSSPPAAGWLSFYWGKRPEEYDDKTMAGAIIGARLKKFAAKGEALQK